jgi:hypothetical protein
MKIALLSDLHLSMHPMPAPTTDADVVVLAGDFGRPAQALEWAGQFEKPTLFVAGNHEFYGSDLVSALAELRARARHTAVRVLECDECQIDGVRFLGCTLWSNHRLYATPEDREIGQQQALGAVRDFTRIGVAPGLDQRLTPALAQRQCDRSVAWLASKLSSPSSGGGPPSSSRISRRHRKASTPGSRGRRSTRVS